MTGDAPTAGDSVDDRLVHDLRTPLTVISGFCELLERQREKLTEEQKTEYLRRVGAAAAEMREILDRERDERLSAG